MLLLLLALADLPADRIAKWEKEVAGIEARLAQEKPAAGGVVFAGSSMIRQWKLDESFPGKGYVNVGFGGAETRDVTHFAPRLVTPLRPATVVFYCGDNDLANARTPRQVADDFAAFCAAVPDARILCLAVKPSPKRWPLFDKQCEANRLVRTRCERESRLRFVDVVPAMLGPDGRPRPELFADDQLHFRAEGYTVWAKAVDDGLAGRP